MFFDLKVDVPDQITKKRENFTENIRRSNREEMFSKRRNLDQKHISDEQHHETEERKKHYVIDGRFSQQIEKFLKNRYYLESLPELVKAIYSADIIQQHYGLIGIRKILSSQDDPPIQPIIDSGLIPKFIQYTKQQQYPQLQLQATWALTNVASGTLGQCQSIVDKGGIPLFIKLLRSSCKGIVEQAIWAIGNIASDCAIHRDAIIKLGGIQNMIYAIEQSSSPQNVQHGLWSLSNLCRGNPMPKYDEIQNALPTLSKKLCQGWITDKQTLSDCLWALAYNIKYSQERVQLLLLNTGFQKLIPKLLYDDEISIIVPTIRILSNITTNRDHLPVVLKQNQLMQALYKLLSAEKKVIRTEVCQVLSNIGAGSQQEVSFLLSHQDIIGRLLILFEGDGATVRSQIAILLGNIIMEGKPEIIFNFFCEIKIISLFLENLKSDDAKFLKVCLQSLFSILQLGESFKNQNGNRFVSEIIAQNGDKVLEQLQLHKDKSVYDQVVRIVSQFFIIDDALNL